MAKVTKLGEKIKYYLVSRGEKQQNLADYSGMLASALSHKLRGTISWHLHELKLICEFLGLDEEETQELLNLARESDQLSDDDQPNTRQDKVSIPQVPLQRPPRVLYFEGRDKEIEKVISKLQPGQIVTLCGPGGVGKSAIAAEVVHRLSHDDRPPERFPDGVIYHRFSDQPQDNFFFEHIIELFGGRHDKMSARDAAEDVLAARQALLILDAVDQADYIGEFLKGCSKCGVLMTSRHRHDIEGIIVDIKPLPPTEARTVLQSWSQGEVDDHSVVEQICQLVGYLPLALRIAGSYMYQRRIKASEYLEILKNTPLAALHLKDRPEQSVPILLAQSVQGLTAPAREVLAVVGLLPVYPFHRRVIMDALEISEDTAVRLLGELINYSLLMRIEDFYMVIHALIATYTSHELTPTLPNKVIDRMVINFTQTVDIISALGPDGYEVLEPALAFCCFLAAECGRREDWKNAELLVWQLNYYFGIQGVPVTLMKDINADTIEMLNEAVIMSAQERSDRQTEGIWTFGRAHMLYRQGRYKQAVNYYAQGFDAFFEDRDDQQQYRHPRSSRWIIRVYYRYLGKILNNPKILKLLNQDLVKNLPRSLHDFLGNGLHIASMDESGDLQKNIYQLKSAVYGNNQALELARKIGDRELENIYLYKLGDAHYNLEQYQAAIDYYEQSIAISRELGDLDNEITNLYYLGLIFNELGQYQTAVNYYRQALTILMKTKTLFVWKFKRRKLETILNDEENI